jgi:hypothetical protein
MREVFITTKALSSLSGLSALVVKYPLQREYRFLN